MNEEFCEIDALKRRMDADSAPQDLFAEEY